MSQLKTAFNKSEEVRTKQKEIILMLKKEVEDMKQGQTIKKKHTKKTAKSKGNVKIA